MAATARYDEVADFYVIEMGAGLDDPATAALLDIVGDVTGRRLLDLACGQGRVARELARRGARVTGVDLSAALVEQAREAEASGRLGIEYLTGDAGDVVAAISPKACGDRRRLGRCSGGRSARTTGRSRPISTRWSATTC